MSPQVQTNTSQFLPISLSHGWAELVEWNNLGAQASLDTTVYKKYNFHLSVSTKPASDNQITSHEKMHPSHST